MQNLLASLAVYLLLIAFGGAAGYHWTKEYYTAKIESANAQAVREKDEIQRKGDELAAQYVNNINAITAHSAAVQKQVERIVVNSPCVIPNGFVRLYNASASGETPTPSDSDGAAAQIDLATILDTAIENNEKYNKVADQLRALQEFERAK